MAEAILNRLGGGRFTAHSAGSHPAGEVNPGALRCLNERGYETAALRSKSWDDYGRDDAPSFDLVITVCDKAAGESCPLWPGRPLTAHWGIPDPAAVTGSGKRQAFDDAYALLAARIEALVELPLESMSRPEKRTALGAIHADQGAG